MDITDRTVLQSALKVRNYDGLIVLGYVAFALVTTVALYTASSGPGVTEFALTTALP